MKTATMVKRLEGFRGDARLYRLDPPLVYVELGEKRSAEYVVVSAVTVPYVGGEETYIFPADETGKVTRWYELPGSFKGDKDHGRALMEAGYDSVTSVD